MKRITYTSMSCKTAIRLVGVARNQANGFPARLLAIDLIQATYEKRYEVAIIVSKDSDFGPAVALAKVIAESQGRKLVFQSAFPVALNTPKKQMRGVPGTQWIHIDQADYDTCRDWNEYRPPSADCESNPAA